MGEKSDREKQREIERAKLIEEIGAGIKTQVISAHHDTPNEYEEYYPEYPFSLNFERIDGEVPAYVLTVTRFEEKKYWVDPKQYSGPRTHEEVVYSIRGANIVKEGFYDFGSIDGEPPVNFLINMDRIDKMRMQQPVVNYSLAPSVSFNELRRLRRIVQNPFGEIASVQKLPLPSTWPRNIVA